MTTYRHTTQARLDAMRLLTIMDEDTVYTSFPSVARAIFSSSSREFILRTHAVIDYLRERGIISVSVPADSIRKLRITWADPSRAVSLRVQAHMYFFVDPIDNYTTQRNTTLGMVGKAI